MESPEINTSVGASMSSFVDQTEKMEALTSGNDERSYVSSTSTRMVDNESVASGELPENKGLDEVNDFSNTVNAGANYVGSFLSSAWSKTTKTATSATAGLSSAFAKVGGNDKSRTDIVNDCDNKAPPETNVAIEDDQSLGGDFDDHERIPVREDVTSDTLSASSSSSFFSGAWKKVQGFTKSTSASWDRLGIVSGGDQKEETGVISVDAEDPAVTEDGEKGSNLISSAFLDNFSSIVSKVAIDATTSLTEKVGQSNLLSEFNKEQEEFIKSKDKSEFCTLGPAPWVGYKEEEDMKRKILSLSDDRRNFVRSPPSGVTFDFDYCSMSSVALTLLQEDTKLSNMRYELVPKIVTEDNFWKNYFYRVNLIKQSFDLKDFESSPNTEDTQQLVDKIVENRLAMTADEDDNSPDVEDEFVSDSYQASTKDMEEVDETMKRLGVRGRAKDNENWEAELEGELKEFEVVSSKDEREDSPEWENQIQEMLEAEDPLK